MPFIIVSGIQEFQLETLRKELKCNNEDLIALLITEHREKYSKSDE